MEYVYEINKNDNWKEIREWLARRNVKFKEHHDKIIVYLDDYMFLYRFDKFVKAVLIGFSVEKSERILSSDWDLVEIDIKMVVKDKPNHIKRIMGRIIGEEGKMLKEISSTSNAEIIVKNDRYIYILGDSYSIEIALAMLNKIIGGSPHQSVLKFGLEYKKGIDYKRKEEKYLDNFEF